MRSGNGTSFPETRTCMIRRRVISIKLYCGRAPKSETSVISARLLHGLRKRLGKRNGIGLGIARLAGLNYILADLCNEVEEVEA